MTELRVDAGKCTRCQTCLRECPSVIIEADPKTGLPYIPERSPYGSCIECSHCAILCPTGALQVSFLPDEARRSADLSLLPRPEQYETLVATRRSVRQFRSQGLSHDEIERILAIANQAPTATNSQNVRWLITEPQTTATLRERCTAHLQARLDRDPDDDYARRHLNRIHRGFDSIFRTAPHVAITLLPRDYLWKDDGIIALTHFDNACHALGYGSCWGGLLLRLLAESAELRASIGIGDEWAISNTILFGARLTPPSSELPLREPVKVRYV